MRDLPPRLTDAELSTLTAEQLMLVKKYEETRERHADLADRLERDASAYHNIITLARSGLSIEQET